MARDARDENRRAHARRRHPGGLVDGPHHLHDVGSVDVRLLLHHQLLLGVEVTLVAMTLRLLQTVDHLLRGYLFVFVLNRFDLLRLRLFRLRQPHHGFRLGLLVLADVLGITQDRRVLDSLLVLKVDVLGDVQGVASGLRGELAAAFLDPGSDDVGVLLLPSRLVPVRVRGVGNWGRALRVVRLDHLDHLRGGGLAIARVGLLGLGVLLGPVMRRSAVLVTVL